MLPRRLTDNAPGIQQRPLKGPSAVSQCCIVHRLRHDLCILKPEFANALMREAHILRRVITVLLAIPDHYGRRPSPPVRFISSPMHHFTPILSQGIADQDIAAYIARGFPRSNKPHPQRRSNTASYGLHLNPVD